MAPFQPQYSGQCALLARCATAPRRRRSLGRLVVATLLLLSLSGCKLFYAGEAIAMMPTTTWTRISATDEHFDRLVSAGQSLGYRTDRDGSDGYALSLDYSGTDSNHRVVFGIKVEGGDLPRIFYACAELELSACQATGERIITKAGLNSRKTN